MVVQLVELVRSRVKTVEQDFVSNCALPTFIVLVQLFLLNAALVESDQHAAKFTRSLLVNRLLASSGWSGQFRMSL